MIRKQQLGFVSWALIFCMLGLAIAFYIIEQSARDEKITRLRNDAPVLTADELKRIDDYKAKPSPVTDLSGIYRGVSTEEGGSIQISYYFGDGKTIAKTVKAGNVSFNGTAKYSVEGSAFVFTEIEGDKALFSKQGEAFSVEADKLFLPSFESPFTLTKDAE